MKMNEQIGEYTVKIDGNMVTAHRGNEPPPDGNLLEKVWKLALRERTGGR